MSEGKEPYQLGQFYQVPHVWSGYYKRYMPVQLPVHEDSKQLSFPYWHLHFDLRFLSLREYNSFVPADLRRTYGQGKVALGKVLHLLVHDNDALMNNEPLNSKWNVKPEFTVVYEEPETINPRVIWMRRRMYQRPFPEFPNTTWSTMRVYIGKPLVDGKLCPHKLVDISSIPADEQGIVQCRCHGLKFRDGVCVATSEPGPFEDKFDNYLNRTY